MAQKKEILSKELIQILTKATDGKIYGSVEIYFEQGQVTQITQRIINKVAKPKTKLEQPQKSKPQASLKSAYSTKKVEEQSYILTQD